MDPRNPYSQSPGYVGLLNSQQQSVIHENFPYESFHSSINLGASENPPFSSRQPHPPTEAEVTPEAHKGRKKWTPADDEVLISAWLNTSKDAVVGNDQNARTFWKRVTQYYAVSPHVKASGQKVEQLSLKQRWHKINDQTNKFCAAYGAAERQISSGQTDTDVLKAAHDMFYADHNFKFTLEHAWCVLRYEQKWFNLNASKGSDNSKRKTGETGSQASVSNVGDEEVRPKGVKAAKARRANGKGKGVDDYKSIWEIKKEDLEMKEKLSKLAILDTLLAKKEPLSEAEKIVKNKLLVQYF